MPFRVGTNRIGRLIVGQTVVPLLLDTYPGVIGAYSLRKLSNSYTGAAIEVRRSSDSATQDIGFVGED